MPKLRITFVVAVLHFTLFSSEANRIRRSDEREFISCPTSCFCDEKNLYVSCVGDAAWDLAFPPIPRTVARLEIRNYNVGTLNLEHLRGMNALQELKLQQTRIDSIANATFFDVKTLERLDLGDNQIENLTTHAFDGLEESLRYIDLSSNRLRNIDEAFKKLALVEQLNLRKNRLANLTINTFIGLHHLQYLNLDSNEIQFIEAGSLILLPNLAHLLLSNNPLSSLTRLDSVTRRLQYVDISNIGLLFIPQGIEPFVRDLRLARNKIKKVTSGELDNYSHLSLLVLDDNQIEEIEQDALGRLEYLIRLWLNGNKLKRVSINLPQSLRELYLEDNLIETVDSNSFRGLINLERLYLKRNQIKILSEGSFRDLRSLKLLDLQSNKIENLTDNAFVNLPSLESLDLSQNNLKYLSSRCFMGVNSVKTLQLSRIKSQEIMFEDNLFADIKKLEILELNESPELVVKLFSKRKVLQSLRTLKELNLMHNNLIRLSDEFPSFFPFLKSIKLSGNSWRCDKHILWLVNWMREAKDVNFFISSDIKCSTPSSLQFKPIKVLTLNDLQQSVTTKSKPLAVSIAANQLTTESLLLVEKAKESYTNSEEKRTNITLLQERRHRFSNVTLLESKSLSESKIFKDSNLKLAKKGSNPVKTMNGEIVNGSWSSSKANNSFSSFNEQRANNQLNGDESKSREALTTFDSLYFTKRERKHISNTSKHSLTSSSDFIRDQKMIADSYAMKASVVVSLICTALLIAVAIVAVFFSFSKYKKCFAINNSSLHRSFRRRKSVSYSSQNDEISIATIATISSKDESDMDFAFKNKLYFTLNGETNH